MRRSRFFAGTPVVVHDDDGDVHDDDGDVGVWPEPGAQDAFEAARLAFELGAAVRAA